MSSPTRFDRACPDRGEVAFVCEHAPEFAPDLRIVAPVSEAAPHASPSPHGFEGGQVFATDEATVIQRSEQDEQVGSQMGEFFVPALLLFPALFDPGRVLLHLLLPPGVMGRQGRASAAVCLLSVLHELLVVVVARFEAIYLPAQTSLPPIDPPGVQKKGAAYLFV